MLVGSGKKGHCWDLLATPSKESLDQVKIISAFNLAEFSNACGGGGGLGGW